MAITGFSAVLYYGIFASVTGGYLPYRVKNWWLVVFHLYLFLSFVILPLIIALVSSPLQPPSPSFTSEILYLCSQPLAIILTIHTNKHTLFSPH